MSEEIMDHVPITQLTRCPANERDGLAMPVHLEKTGDSLSIVSGRMRLQAALSLSDEVKVNDAELGDLLVVKLPDGSLIATRDEQTMKLMGF